MAARVPPRFSMQRSNPHPSSQLQPYKPRSCSYSTQHVQAKKSYIPPEIADHLRGCLSPHHKKGVSQPRHLKLREIKPFPKIALFSLRSKKSSNDLNIQAHPARITLSKPLQFLPQRRLYSTKSQVVNSSMSPSNGPINNPSDPIQKTAFILSLLCFMTLFAFSVDVSNQQISIIEWSKLMELLEIPHSQLESDLTEVQETCFNAIYKAMKEKRWDIIDKVDPKTLSLLKDSEGWSLLRLAIENGEEEIVSQLLRRSICHEDVDVQGNTPLHIAAKIGIPSTHRILLEYYSENDPKNTFNPNRKNCQGLTPLHLAIQEGHHDSVGVLLKRASLEKQQTQDQGTVLHWAVSCGQSSIIGYLLSQYYQTILPLLESKDKEGRTPLALAAYLGEAYAINILARFGADIKAVDSFGRQPIHYACMGFQREAIDALACLHADLSPHDNNDERPEDYLRKHPNPKVLLDLLYNIRQGKQEPLHPFAAPPLNLVFQGGGPKGIAEIAALEALEKRQLLDSIERVAGTSAGAIMAALVAVGYKSQDLYNSLGTVDLKTWLPINLELKGFFDDLEKQFRQISSKGLPSKPGIVKQCLTFFWKKWWMSKDAKKALDDGWAAGGLAKGQEFLDWIDQQLTSKTGIQNYTFGEHAELVRQGKAKHLHIYATLIGDNPHPVYFTSEDPACADIIISHTIRMSMSIPVAFEPHIIHIKGPNGEVIPCPERGYFLDGGLLQNFPIQVFDYKKYKPNLAPGENPDETWYNSRTWGVSLYSPADAPKTPQTHDTWGVLKNIGNLLYNAEMTLKESEVSSLRRTIRIDNQGVGLFDFDLKPEKKQQLIDAGRKTTQTFLKQYAPGRIGRNEAFFDLGSFQKKEADGQLFLPLPHPDFLGREKELEDLENCLVNPSNWVNQVTRMDLIAPSGYGKSQLAIAFASKNIGKFSYIWQIDLRNQETFERSYRNLAKTLGVNLSAQDSSDKIPIDELAKQVNVKLEKAGSKSPWLIVFDNADNGLPVPLPEKGGSVLITGQDANKLPGAKPYNLQQMTPKDAQKLMQDILGEQTSTQQEMVRLTEQLQRIPVLINQAAHYIANTPGSTPAKYSAALESRVGKESKDHLQLMSACWNISSAYLQHKLPETYEWITVCSYLNSNGIPKQWLTEWLARKEGQNVSLPHYRKQKEMIEFLKTYGIVYSHPYDDTFSIHGLLQKTILESPVSQRQQLLDGFVPFLTSLSEIKNFNPTHPEAVMPFRRAAPHCVSLLEHLPHSEHKKQLMFTLIRYYWETETNLTQARKFLDEAKQWSLNTHPLQGRILFFEALVKKDAASLEKDPLKKKELLQEALSDFGNARAEFGRSSNLKEYEGLEQNRAKCNPEYQRAISLQYQAEVYLDLKNTFEANTLLDQSLKEFEALKNSPKPDHLKSDYNYDIYDYDITRTHRGYARILLINNQLKDAEKKFLDVLDLQKEAYKYHFESHKTVAVTHRYLGDVYEQMNTPESLEKAELAYKKALETNDRAFKTPFNPRNKELYLRRAGIAKRQHKEKFAEELIKKANKIDEVLSKQQL